MRSASACTSAAATETWMCSRRKGTPTAARPTSRRYPARGHRCLFPNSTGFSSPLATIPANRQPSGYFAQYRKLRRNLSSNMSSVRDLLSRTCDCRRSFDRQLRLHRAVGHIVEPAVIVGKLAYRLGSHWIKVALPHPSDDDQASVCVRSKFAEGTDFQFSFHRLAFFSSDRDRWRRSSRTADCLRRRLDRGSALSRCTALSPV